MTSRRWCFTLNNPKENEIQQWNKEQIKILVCQLEEGLHGTTHLQGYLETKNAIRLTQLKTLCQRAHWEKAKGSPFQAIEYCLKTDTALGPKWWMCDGCLEDFNEEKPQSLQRHLTRLSSRHNGGNTSVKLRLSEIQEILSQGNSDAIEKVADNEFDLWIKYYRAFEKYLLIKTPPRNFKTQVHVLQGPTGTGKSKWAMDTFPNAYWKQRSNWWDGYMGHEHVIIDEFYGWLPFDLVLRLCDRYPMMVETKGGQVQFTAKTIVFTTNMLPANWYRNAYFPSFARRVDTWHVLPIWGEHQQYVDYGEFLKKASDNIFTP